MGWRGGEKAEIRGERLEWWLMQNLHKIAEAKANDRINLGHLEKRRYLHLHPLIKKHLTVPKGKYLHINRVIKEAQVVFDQ